MQELSKRACSHGKALLALSKTPSLRAPHSKFQLCIDYRKLNSLLPPVTPATGTKKGVFALMTPAKNRWVIHITQGSKILYSTWSLQWLHTTSNWIESIPKSTFTTVFGKFEFLRLSCGLSRGPDFFIYLIHDLFGLNKTSNQSHGSGCLAYLDDILIYRKRTFRNVEQCFQMLMQSQS